LKHAEAVVVITGTAGWEGLCLGLPVLVLGDAPYTSIGEGLRVESNLSALSTALAEVRKMPPASDETLVRYLQALLDCSFEMPPKTIFGGYDQVGEDTVLLAAASIATRLRYLGNGAC